MSEPASISSGIAARYAAAIFDLAFEDKQLPRLEADVASFQAALDESADLKAMIASLVISRDDQANAIAAIGAKMGASELLLNTLKLMAERRRLFVLPQFLRILAARLADERGEVRADVTSAAPLSAAQKKNLAAVLKQRAGKDVKLETAVDETLIGGLIVRLGSTMVDTSIRSKLAALKNTMKEVG